LVRSVSPSGDDGGTHLPHFCFAGADADEAMTMMMLSQQRIGTCLSRSEDSLAVLAGEEQSKRPVKGAPLPNFLATDLTRALKGIAGFALIKFRT